MSHTSVILVKIVLRPPAMIAMKISAKLINILVLAELMTYLRKLIFVMFFPAKTLWYTKFSMYEVYFVTHPY